MFSITQLWSNLAHTAMLCTAASGCMLVLRQRSATLNFPLHACMPVYSTAVLHSIFLAQLAKALPTVVAQVCHHAHSSCSAAPATCSLPADSSPLSADLKDSEAVLFPGLLCFLHLGRRSSGTTPALTLARAADCKQGAAGRRSAGCCGCRQKAGTRRHCCSSLHAMPAKRGSTCCRA